MYKSTKRLCQGISVQDIQDRLDDSADELPKGDEYHVVLFPPTNDVGEHGDDYPSDKDISLNPNQGASLNRNLLMQEGELHVTRFNNDGSDTDEDFGLDDDPVRTTVMTPLSTVPLMSRVRGRAGSPQPIVHSPQPGPSGVARQGRAATAHNGSSDDDEVGDDECEDSDVLRRELFERPKTPKRKKSLSSTHHPPSSPVSRGDTSALSETDFSDTSVKMVDPIPGICVSDSDPPPPKRRKRSVPEPADGGDWPARREKLFLRLKEKANQRNLLKAMSSCPAPNVPSAAPTVDVSTPPRHGRGRGRGRQSVPLVDVSQSVVSVSLPVAVTPTGQPIPSVSGQSTPCCRPGRGRGRGKSVPVRGQSGVRGRGRGRGGRGTSTQPSSRVSDYTHDARFKFPVHPDYLVRDDNELFW